MYVARLAVRSGRSRRIEFLKSALWQISQRHVLDAVGSGPKLFEIDPTDTESIAEALLQVATDEALRADLIHRGAARSTDLAWSTIAGRHRAVWEQVIRDREAGDGR